MEASCPEVIFIDVSVRRVSQNYVAYEETKLHEESDF